MASTVTDRLVASVKKKFAVTTLDEFVYGNNKNNSNKIKKVDFIKADIEGAERDMLKGATQVLREHAPKLAICTYHMSDDPVVLEGIIRAANPAYTVVHLHAKLFACVTH
jgi:hypothetical protein